MVSQKEKLKCISQILDNEVKGKRIKLIKALYKEYYIDEEEWLNKKFFVFQNIDTEKTFSIRESVLTNLGFKFKRELVYMVEKLGKLILIANDEMVLYRVGERRIYCYIFRTKETIRLDNMLKDEVLGITRSAKPITKPIIKPIKK